MQTFRLLLLLLLLGSRVAVAEQCPLPKLEAVTKEHPECLFFTGTAAYRGEKYEQAFESWTALLALNNIPIENEHLQTSAMNNLGYLSYTGKGTARSTEKAIELWRTAFGRGHEEAAYHLCHVYAEPKEPEYSPPLARGYCKEAFRRYAAIRDEDGENKELLEELQRYIASLPTQ